AATVEADAAFVGGERVFQAHLAALHLFDQLFKRVERGFEVGDGGRGVGGIGRAWHGCQFTPSPASAAWRRAPAARRTGTRRGCGRPPPAAGRRRRTA